MFVTAPLPFSHLLPEINVFPFPNLLIVSKQLFSHLPHLTCEMWISNESNSLDFNIVELYSMSRLDSYCSFANNATPYAPINPAILGRMTFFPTISSKLLNTASL